MVLDLTSFKKAVESLESAVNVACSDEQMNKMSEAARETIKAGVIQNFEFTYELSWKFMKRWLGDNLGSALVDGLNRRELFRLAFEHQLISDVERWLGYHDSRNETSHTYNRATAQEVFEAAVNFIADAKELLANLEKRNS